LESGESYCVAGVAGDPSALVDAPDAYEPPCDPSPLPLIGAEDLFDLAEQLVADGTGAVRYGESGLPEEIEIFDESGLGPVYQVAQFEFVD
ncbi:MAG: hypothetical protein AAGK32_14840, partial [Actinomycetota bacterium]